MIRGAQISWNYEELSETLRAETHGHPPIVMVSAASNQYRQEVLDGQKKSHRALGGSLAAAVMIVYESILD